jgi:hypothetical protein
VIAFLCGVFRGLERDVVICIPVTSKPVLLDMRFQVLRVMSMKMTAFWDVAPCSLVEVD